jgi:hypothetical protein
MTMVFLISSLFSITAFFAFFKIYDKYLTRIIYICLVILAMLLAIFRIPEESSDYFNYVFIYNNPDKLWGAEFSYLLLVLIIRQTINNVMFLFAFYAIFAVSIKGYIFNKFAAYPLITLLAYFSYEYISQELAAMRAGLAIAFILLLIKPLYERKYIPFFLLGAIATFFHNSALSFIFLPFICLFNTKYKLLFLFMLCIAIPFFIQPIMNSILPRIFSNGYINRKIGQYIVDKSSISDAFRFSTLYRYVIFLFLLPFSKQIVKYNKYFICEMSIFIFGCLLNSLFYFSEVICYRLSAIYYSVEVLLFQNFFYIFKSKSFAKMLVIILLTIELIHLFLVTDRI